AEDAQKEHGLSTGSTLLNLALTGKTTGGLDRGCYYLIVGSSSGGKTFAVLTALAEASIDPHFADYRLTATQTNSNRPANREAALGSAISNLLNALFQ
ncbi:MAG: hypothetical protein EBR33_08250, partial [Synechococcaceae bacterium WB4_1_0192]|nr:hypothetical protein [Synechococcaceae bacterium WB4_1_0192]